MIHFITACLVLFLTSVTTLFSQAPSTMNYQAVLRDAGGTILKNTSASVQLVIHKGSETGTQVYTETHIPPPMHLVWLIWKWDLWMSPLFQPSTGRPDPIL